MLLFLASRLQCKSAASSAASQSVPGEKAAVPSPGGNDHHTFKEISKPSFDVSFVTRFPTFSCEVHYIGNDWILG